MKANCYDDKSVLVNNLVKDEFYGIFLFRNFTSKYINIKKFSRKKDQNAYS